jgi:hypothetical protein
MSIWQLDANFVTIHLIDAIKRVGIVEVDVVQCEEDHLRWRGEKRIHQRR